VSTLKERSYFKPHETPPADIPEWERRKAISLALLLATQLVDETVRKGISIINDERLTAANIALRYWWAPGIIRLLAGAVAAGRPRSEGFENRNVHIMRPETANTNHYLFAATRNFRVETKRSISKCPTRAARFSRRKTYRRSKPARRKWASAISGARDPFYSAWMLGRFLCVAYSIR
jgi:hypothetical protein